MPNGYTCLLPGSPSFLCAATTSHGRRLAAILRPHRYHKGDPLLWLGILVGGYTTDTHPNAQVADRIPSLSTGNARVAGRGAGADLAPACSWSICLGH